LAPEHLALDRSKLEQIEKGGGRYGVEAQVLRSLSSPAMQSLIESNPEVAKEVAQVLANSTHKGALRGVNSGAVAPSEQDIAALQGKTGDYLAKRTSTAQILNQRQYAVVLDSLFEEGTKLMPSVTKYAGAHGKAQLAKDSAKAAMGEIKPQYSEYLQFTNVVAPNVANEMRRVLGGQATDYEAKVMNNLSNPSFWLTNPTLANQQWDFMNNMFKKKISPSLTVGLSGATKHINEMAKGIASPKEKITNEDIQYTAQQTGMSVEQVIEKARAQGLL
jgi:NACalpha-BTF3-like transcription factor